MRGRPVKFIAYPPDGSAPLRANSIGEFCREHDLDLGNVWRCLAGRQPEHKGWQFRKEAPSEPEPKPKPAVADPDSEEIQMEPLPVRGGMTDEEWRKAVLLWARCCRAVVGNKITLYLNEPHLAPAKWNARNVIDSIKAMVEAEGIEWGAVHDARSDGQKIADTMARVMDCPKDLFEALDDELAAIDGAINDAISLCDKYVEDRSESLMKKSGIPHSLLPQWYAGMTEEERREWFGGRDPKSCWLIFHRWKVRIRKIIQLKTWAREEYPMALRPLCDDRGNEKKAVAIKASHLLRYMIWVGRSDIPECKYGVFQVGYHHAKIACDLYRLKNQGKIHGLLGILCRGDMVSDMAGVRRRFPGSGQDGGLFAFPPRHGKTVLFRHFAALEMCKNPRIQIAYIHAREKEALAFNAYVQSMFGRDTDTGKRNLSLFPEIRLADRDNTRSTTRLLVNDPPKNPTFTGQPIDASALGNNYDLLIGDDLVPSSDAEQPTERERRKRQFSSTWLTRLQGDQSYYIVSGYPHHFDDLVSSMKDDIIQCYRTKGRMGKNCLLSEMWCGGPKDKPKYKPIWPQMYGARKLRQIRSRLANDALFSANYCGKPLTDELRIVRKVRIYDPMPIDDPDQHERFMRVAQIHLSADPAFSNNTKSDKAGLVKVAVGMLETHKQTPSGVHIQSRMVIRVLRADEIKATQKELADTISGIVKAGRVDFCHVEARSEGSAIAEMLTNFYGITPITHNPGNRDKKRRLRQVAPMIEDDSEGITPVVEFPGIRVTDAVGNTTLELDPKVKTLWNYIVNYDATSGHHNLDAFTQVAAYLAPMVGVGTTGIGREVRSHGPAKPVEGYKARMVREEREHRARMEQVGVLGYSGGGQV